MSTTEALIRRNPEPLVSTPVHLGIAVAAAGVVILAWASAGRASDEAVHTAANSISRPVIYVTLPSVEIVARRKSAALTRLREA